jgi:hypothetical protein
MKDGTATPIAMIAGAFAVICCAGPLLIAAIGTAALTGWLTNSAYVLIPAAIAGLGLGGLWYYRRRMTAQGSCHSIDVNKARNHG